MLKNSNIRTKSKFFWQHWHTQSYFMAVDIFKWLRQPLLYPNTLNCRPEQWHRQGGACGFIYTQSVHQCTHFLMLSYLVHNR